MQEQNNNDRIIRELLARHAEHINGSKKMTPGELKKFEQAINNLPAADQDELKRLMETADNLQKALQRRR